MPRKTTLAVVEGAAAADALADLIDQYLEHHMARGHSPRTYGHAYARPLRNILLPWCRREGVTEVDGITVRHLDRLAGELLSSGNPFVSDPARRGQELSKHSVHAYMRAINSFLTWARERGEATTTAKAPLPKLDRRVLETLTRDQVNRMEDAAAAERDKLIIRVLADTGIRLGELLELRPEDIREPRKGEFYLRVHGKGDKERLVPMTPALRRRLGKLIAGRRDEAAGRIFVSLRRTRRGYAPLTHSGIQQMIRAIAEVAGVDQRVYPHLFRHTYATEALRRGMNPLVLQKILGHETLDMITSVYSHLNVSDTHAAAMRMLADEG